MLTPEQIEAAGEMVGAVYREMEAEMLDHLASVMASGGGMTERTMTELALLAQSQSEALARIVERYRPMVDEAVLAAAEEFLGLSDADDVARAGGEPAWPRQIGATIAGISEILSRDNIQMAQGAKDAFLQASAQAVTEVNSGMRTGEEALRRAVRNLERQGIGIVTYQDSATGRATVRNKADVAVRRHVRTQIAQDGLRMTKERMERLQVTLVEVSSHPGARPEHAEWQGRCYSLKGAQVIDGTEYPDLREATDYGTVTGLGGANCRHSFGPYRHGAPRMYYPDPQPDCGVTSGELYDLEQGQRYRERRIREAKRELRGAQILYDADPSMANLTNLNKAKNLLKGRQAAMREYIDSANAKGNGKPVLRRHPDREWAGDMPKSARKSATMGAMRHEEPLVKMSADRNALSVSPVVNTKRYHDAFEAMPVPRPVAEGAYREAGRILSAASGGQREYLSAVSARTGNLVADNLDTPAEEGRTGFGEAQREAIEAFPGRIVLIHNHPGSTRPSIRDVITAAEEESVAASVVAGHDGSVWFVSVDDPAIAPIAKGLYNRAKQDFGERGGIVAMDQLLKLNEEHHLFTWRRLR
ncbi:phage minor capsid protein [Parvibacter caecicola]|uniref:phage minor capsid protein n=1 Tax=Parvibacter caecicola TaxID=747645 RepID=UPI002730E158|nr:phage minor capsid protein [Parvibacter caecicola]